MRRNGPTFDAFAADHVVTLDGPTLSPGWVGVSEGRIREIGEGDPPRDLLADRGGRGSILLPGLVSAHTHLALGRFRHVADDLAFLAWLQRGLLPRIEEAARAPEIYRDGARASAAELLAAGVTTVAEVFLRADGVDALRETGQRGIFFQEVFGSFAPDEDAYLAEAGRMLTAVEDGLDGFPLGFAPHTPWTCPPRILSAVVARARAERRRFTIHLDESQEEHAFFTGAASPIRDLLERKGSLGRFQPGPTPTAALDRLGVLGPDLLAVHAVRITPSDIALLAESGTHVVHCPISNMKLAEGFAPVVEMLEAGIPVALGVDSVASTDRLDLFEEMRACLLVQRARQGKVGAMTARTVLEMATRNGARALGMEASIGSITPGKHADLVRVAPPAAAADGGAAPEAVVVHACRGADVVLVAIGGEVRYRRGW